MTVVKNKDALSRYDEIPYSSYPHTYSRPDNLRTIGQLFGMNPPELETARVLEIGCAEGWNIIPHAAKYPNAEFVGLDLSKVEIDAGRVHAENMGLKNIELKHMSIMDVDQEMGVFDYIICHGVISWVPEDVRDRTLAICAAHLSPQGIAYISYNALPGWNTVKTVRDMMLYHAEGFVDTREKIAQSKLLLGMVNQTLEQLGQATELHALNCRNEANMLSRHSDSYVLHDYLAKHNKAYYFSEFIAEADKHGLKYLAESNLSSSYIGNFPERTAEYLYCIDDIVKTEQYIDFMVNRRFRSTLLCHRSVKLRRALDKSIAKEFAMNTNFYSDDSLRNIDFEQDENLTFYCNREKEQTVKVRSKLSKALLYTFYENQMNPLSFDKVVELTSAKLKTVEKAAIEKELENNALLWLFKNVIQFSSEFIDYSKIRLDKPRLSKIATYQMADMPELLATNSRHESVKITPFEKMVGPCLDGETTLPQLLEKVLEAARAGKFTFELDSKTIMDEKLLRQNLPAKLEEVIVKFFKVGLLV